MKRPIQKNKVHSYHACTVNLQCLTILFGAAAVTPLLGSLKFDQVPQALKSNDRWTSLPVTNSRLLGMCYLPAIALNLVLECSIFKQPFWGRDCLWYSILLILEPCMVNKYKLPRLSSQALIIFKRSAISVLILDKFWGAFLEG